FRELTDKAIRRASFVSVPDLKQAIDEFMESWNQNPKPFIWTAGRIASPDILLMRYAASRKM
ncbi:MAG: hypothetical protein ACREIF_02645, partial [Chthoniobacterales bacterium]